MRLRIMTAVLLLGACRGPAPAAPRALPARAGCDAAARAVAPGDPWVDGRRLRSGTSRYSWIMVQGGREQPVGTRTDVLVVRGDGRVSRVQTVQRGSWALVDSTVAEERTLAPRIHRSHQSTRTVSLDFAGARVNGRAVSGDSVQPVSAVLERPAFDSGNWDLVVRALPLRRGFAARVAVFDHEAAGLAWYPVCVVGQEAAGPHGIPAWRVEARLSRSTITLWVDRATRDVIRFESTLQNGAILRQEPA